MRGVKECPHYDQGQPTGSRKAASNQLLVGASGLMFPGLKRSNPPLSIG